MSRLFNKGNPDKITIGSPNTLTGKMTFGCWFNLASFPPSAFNQYTFIASTTAGNPRNYAFDIRTNGGTDLLFEFSYTVGGSFSEQRTAAFPPLFFGWHHLCWSINFLNPVVANCYFDGIPQVVSSTGVAGGTPQGGTVCDLGIDNGVAPFDGAMQELFITTDMLAVEDIIRLSKGAPTYSIIKRHPLELYLPLGVGMAEVDLSPNRHSVTLTGTKLSGSPLLMTPAMQRGFFNQAPPAGGGGFKPYWANSNNLPVIGTGTY